MSRTDAVDDLQALGLGDDEAESLIVAQTAGLRTTSNESRACVGYLHTTHPETGLAVVFVPGEGLPDWALAVQRQRNAPAATEPPVVAQRPLRASAAKAEAKAKD